MSLHACFLIWKSPFCYEVIKLDWPRNRATHLYIPYKWSTNLKDYLLSHYFFMKLQSLCKLVEMKNTYRTEKSSSFDESDGTVPFPHIDIAKFYELFHYELSMAEKFETFFYAVGQESKMGLEIIHCRRNQISNWREIQCDGRRFEKSTNFFKCARNNYKSPEFWRADA